MAQQYPRELNLGPEIEERLISYLEDELLNHYADRDVFVDDVKRWQKDYWAKPPKDKVTFPFTGASTIVIPLTAIAVEAIHSRIMTTLFGLSQFVSVKPKTAAFTHLARPYEQWLDHVCLNDIGVEKQLNDPILEIGKFGTGCALSSYERIVKTAVRDAPDGTSQDFEVVTKQGPTLDGVPITNLLMPLYAKDPQTSPWVGQQHSRTPYEVKQLEHSGFFREGTFDKLINYVTATQIEGQHGERKYENFVAELGDLKAAWPQRIDWVEIWLSFAVDGEKDREIVVHLHRPSKTIMSVRYNWYDDLRRPYRLGVYFPLEYRWNGVGICKQNEQFQREVTTQHRQRLDNGTLANVQMLKVKKLSGYGPKEPIFPGKIWFVDDPSDVESFKFSELYPSAYNNENQTVIYSQQRTGVNEVTLGMPQVGTPGTATSDLARIQEGNKKFDFVYKNIKRFTNELVGDIASNLRQFGPKNESYYSVNENGPLIMQLMQLPPDMLRDALVMEVGVAGQQNNKLIDRQNWQTVAALIQQYYTAVSNIAMQTGDQQMMAVIGQKGYVAATEAMKQILEAYDIRNVDRIILSEILNGGPQQLSGAGQNQGPPGIGAPQ